jgi:hypothetical protein
VLRIRWRGLPVPSGFVTVDWLDSTFFAVTYQYVSPFSKRMHSRRFGATSRIAFRPRCSRSSTGFGILPPARA